MANIEQIKKATMEFDWQQVVLNGGPPCFHICLNGRFCGRAKSWDGHENIHEFKSLGKLVDEVKEQAEREVLIDVIEQSIR